MPSIGMPQYSSAAGPARPTAPISAAVLPAMVYAGALPATAMTTESNRPRTLARRPCSATTGGDAGSMFVVMGAPSSARAYGPHTQTSHCGHDHNHRVADGADSLPGNGTGRVFRQVLPLLSSISHKWSSAC